MLIIFGWEKRVDFVRSAFSAYCYNCQASKAWEHFKESEWACLFYIKTIPFLIKHHLVCEGCRDELVLNAESKTRLFQLAKATNQEEKVWLTEGFSKLVELQQLKNKTEAQKQFIRSIRDQASDQTG